MCEEGRGREGGLGRRARVVVGGDREGGKGRRPLGARERVVRAGPTRNSQPKRLHLLVTIGYARLDAVLARNRGQQHDPAAPTANSRPPLAHAPALLPPSCPRPPRSRTRSYRCRRPCRSTPSRASPAPSRALSPFLASARDVRRRSSSSCRPDTLPPCPLCLQALHLLHPALADGPGRQLGLQALLCQAARVQGRASLPARPSFSSASARPAELTLLPRALLVLCLSLLRATLAPLARQERAGLPDGRRPGLRREPQPGPPARRGRPPAPVPGRVGRQPAAV